MLPPSPMSEDVPAFYDCAEASAFEFILNPFLFFSRTRCMKFDILHNTARTAHFDALQSMFRAAETASAASRRATKHLVHRTRPSSPLPPSSLDVRAAVCDDTFATPLQIFLEQPLRRYPYDRCVIAGARCAPERGAPCASHRVTMHCTSRCAADRQCRPLRIASSAETTTPAGCGRRA